MRFLILLFRDNQLIYRIGKEKFRNQVAKVKSLL